MQRWTGVPGFMTLWLCAGLAAYACQPRRASDAGEWQGRTLVEDVSYPEGAAYFGGKLYYVGYGDGTVNVWDGKRSHRLWQLDQSGPCAVVPVGEQGELLVACYDNNTLVRLDAERKTLETIDVKKWGGNGPNDFAKDHRGGVYFSASGAFEKTAPATGKVFYRDRQGKVQSVAEKIHYANGLAVTNGGKNLLVAEMLEGRILTFEVKEDGSLSEKGAVWKRLSEIRPDPQDKQWFIGPDGLKTDSKGNLYICEFGTGRVLVTDAKGVWLRTLCVPYKYVTNVALDPENEGVVYITAAKDAWNKPYGGAVYEIPNR
jgi:gluconolactonase